jgi:hypothetical protein
MPSGSRRAATRVLSLAMIAIGVALIVRTIVSGGGAVAVGILLGLLFVAAGVGRLYLSRGG